VSAATWLLAARPKTLPAAAAPVLVGVAVAWAEGAFVVLPALAALFGALLIQIGTNFANDYFDFVQGADTAERIGPTRAVAAGLVSPAAMKRGFVVAFGLAFLVGITLVIRGGWPIVAIGLASIASGVAYTAGKHSLAYLGLGDIFAFVFFGPVAVAGTHYVQALRWSEKALLASIPIGCLVVAILVVNNVRDVDTDRAAGKRTLPARFGRGFGRVEYFVLLLAAYSLPIVFLATGRTGWPALLPLATLPLALGPLRAVLTTTDGPALNRALGQTARLLAAFGLLWAVGLAVG
jgi:1,4-dihydroxy-2-naphthoate octaprenyltransferase